MTDEKRKCLHCGKEFVLLKDGAGKRYCCKTCQINYNKIKARDRYYSVYKEANRQKRAEAKEKSKAAQATESIADIQRKARTAGMSYGKYMLAKQMGQIG